MSTVKDGFGNEWPRCDLNEKCGLHVVRPGKAQCWCDDAKLFAFSLIEENTELINKNYKLKDENKSLQVLVKDKQRLDWLERNWVNWPLGTTTTMHSLREAIDRAMQNDPE